MMTTGTDSLALARTDTMSAMTSPRGLPCSRACSVVIPWIAAASAGMSRSGWAIQSCTIGRPSRGR